MQCCKFQLKCLQFSQNGIIFSHTEYYIGTSMIQEEKFEKVCKNFSLLNEEQQDYIIGILQALVFAKSSYNMSNQENQPKSDGQTD